ncbi:MAG: type I DNA topoisomerase [Alphaproteobacteria bacterium]|nr:type I DNA topoisomerase [Alphaproteobacteria bacterium]
MHVVVVESPAKAKTINKYLGKDYTVLASFGHVRDLASKDGSVRPEEDFALDWEMDAKGAKQVKAIAEALRDADRLILATDPDREGEAISWHVLEALQQKRALKGKPVDRVTFNAITKDAVAKAMSAPRQIDMELVDAYLARRALDYLIGYTLSPVLWRKLPGARSAGRVQSVALRLICEREMEIERFRSVEFWTVEAGMTTPRGEAFSARLVTLDGQKLKPHDLGDKTKAHAARDAVKAGRYSVAAVEANPIKRAPPPPFMTSTLQMEAARKLGFSATRTMQAAQRLYEGVDIGGETVGLITYMRTDGVQMDGGAIAQLRRAIESAFGQQYVPQSPRQYQTKAKNAQEAHEAIRPTDAFLRPGQVRLEGDLGRLYELIWKRAVASQMESARLERTTVDLRDANGRADLRATGQVVLFDGFLRLYEEGRDDVEDEDGRKLPKLIQGEAVAIAHVQADQHFTQAPPRFSEATLVKRLEELGIGRPSTYASILEKLREKDYVRMDKNRFIPEDRGRLVTAFLENFFNRYVEYDFTAGLEEKLDLVSAGDLGWKSLMREFWSDFSKAVGDIGELRVSNVLDALNESLGPHIFPDREDGLDPRACRSCADGRLSLRVGKYGAFIGCSNHPECKYTRPLAPADGGAPEGDRGLGEDPESGEPIALKIGRFGPYVQRGEGADAKRASLPKEWPPDSIDLERALRLLGLPREIGPHPEDGEMMRAGLGRYGPYVQHGKTYANLGGVEDVFEVQANRAVALLAEKRAGGKGRFQRGAPAALRELGESPLTGKPVKLMPGRYGVYLTDGETNATLPKEVTAEAVTLDLALILLAKRRESAPPKKAKKAPLKAQAAGRKPDGKAKAGAVKKKPAQTKSAAQEKPATPKKPAVKPAKKTGAG